MCTKLEIDQFTKLIFWCRNIGYEEFELPTQDAKGALPVPAEGFGGSVESGVLTPESLPSPDRPPLRHIDKYVRPECPCLSKRMTVAVLTCMGFIIMFGMRCNMGMAKLKTDKGVSNFYIKATPFLAWQFFMFSITANDCHRVMELIIMNRFME